MKNNDTCGMTLVVKVITRLTVGLILIYGIYIILQGHIGPGGGFAGGVIMALSLIHLVLAFGKDAVLKKVNEKKGVLIASLAALFGLFLSGLGFFGQKRFIILADLANAIMVSCALFVIFLVLVFLTREVNGK